MTRRDFSVAFRGGAGKTTGNPRRTMPTLIVSALTRTFAGRRMPDGVSFSVGAGELVAITGPSGGGKSALLRCIAGSDTPEAGKITLDGMSWAAVPAHLRPVATVAQGAALWPQMTVRANLAFGPESLGLPAAEVKSRVDAALRLFGVETLAERRPSTLSGGEQARVALARGVARGASVMLLDEPFAWLDAAERDAALALLRAHARETGVRTLIATRDAGVIAACDRVVVMEGGRVVQTDTPEALWRRPLTVAAALAAGPANLIPATVVRCGAGEFLAESELGELRGALADADAEPGPGARITVMIRPEHLRVSDMPPDENVFGGVREGVSPSRAETRFRTAAGPVLTIREVAAPCASEPDDETPLYAWAMPEDVVGLA